MHGQVPLKVAVSKQPRAALQLYGPNPKREALCIRQGAKGGE